MRISHPARRGRLHKVREVDGTQPVRKLRGNNMFYVQGLRGQMWVHTKRDDPSTNHVQVEECEAGIQMAA